MQKGLNQEGTETVISVVWRNTGTEFSRPRGSALFIRVVETKRGKPHRVPHSEQRVIPGTATRKGFPCARG
jgi:hypothetical protein